MKTKKLVILATIIVLCTGLFFTAYGAYDEIEYEDVVFSKELKLQAKYLPEKEHVELTWTPYFSNDNIFTGYFILRTNKQEEANEEFVPLDVLAIKVLNDKHSGVYEDDNSNDDDNILYYRICSISKPLRFCSNIVKVDKAEDTKEFKLEAGVKEEQGIVLNGEVKKGYIEIKWRYPSGSPYGYRVLKSKTHENPSYPPQKGDTVKTIKSTFAQTYKDEDIEENQKYYYRVCTIDSNSKCAKYSNSIDLDTSRSAKSYSPFLDIKEHWGRQFIENLHREGIVKGVNETNFDPDRNITRAEFLKIVLMAIHRNDVPGTVEEKPFLDINTTDWFAPFAKLAKDKEIVKGYDGGKYFRPHNNITRAEAIKIALVARGFSDFSITNSSFIDVKEPWQIPVVEKAKDLEIVSGYDEKKFGPNDPLTRVQACKIISLVKAIEISE